jgi:hypothetical protein
MAACINVCLAINIPIDHTELVARGIADNWEVLIVLTAAATLPATNIFFLLLFIRANEAPQIGAQKRTKRIQ